MVYIAVLDDVISSNRRDKNSFFFFFFLQPLMSPNPPALFPLLMRFIVQLSSHQPFILLRSSHSFGTFGQVLWHELADPVPQANKFSLYSQSFHGNLISSTLTALSSFLAGFFSSCSSPFPFFAFIESIYSAFPQS